MHFRALLHGNAAPALELVGVRRAVWHAAALVVVVEAGGAGPVIVRLGAAAQALVVATLPPFCAGKLAAIRAHLGERERERERQGGGQFWADVNGRHCGTLVQQSQE